MIEIASSSNATFRRLLSLTTSKGLKDEGCFLLSGQKLITEFLKARALSITHEIIAPGHAALLATDASVVKLALSPELFDRLDVLGTHANLLVITQPPIPALLDLSQYHPQGIEVVLPIGDPGNLGALIRSCEAFHVPRVILTQQAAHPFLPRSVKASAGSVLRMPLARGPDLAQFPADCIALDMDGVPITKFVWPKDGLLVVGEEGQGLGEHPFHTRICIPTRGVESLNAVVAASIALWQRPH